MHPCQNSLKPRCCAVVNGTERCPNETIGDSRHCINHHDTATRLYLKYKKICNQADKFTPNKQFNSKEEQIKYLMRYYDTLNKAYEARYTHRQYAFVPECSDEGHNLQFDILDQKIKDCEDRLQNVFDSLPLALPPIPTDPVEAPIETSNPIEEAKLSIKSYRKKRIDDTDTDNKLMTEYIRRNQLILKRRAKYGKSVVSAIVKHFPVPPMNKKCTHIFLIMFHNLINELDDEGYYVKDYKPHRCKEPECQKCLSTTLHLGCGCCEKYNTAQLYFAGFTVPICKLIISDIKRNKDKLLPLFNDMLKLHKTLHGGLLTAKLKLGWSEKEKRLVLTHDPSCSPEYLRPSQQMARFRQKKWIIMKYMKEEFEEEDEEEKIKEKKRKERIKEEIKI